MGPIDIRAHCVLWVRALHPRGGEALRVLALRATRLVSDYNEKEARSSILALRQQLSKAGKP